MIFSSGTLLNARATYEKVQFFQATTLAGYTLYIA